MGALNPLMSRLRILEYYYFTLQDSLMKNFYGSGRSVVPVQEQETVALWLVADGAYSLVLRRTAEGSGTNMD